MLPFSGASHFWVAPFWPTPVSPFVFQCEIAASDPLLASVAMASYGWGFPPQRYPMVSFWVPKVSPMVSLAMASYSFLLWFPTLSYGLLWLPIVLYVSLYGFPCFPCSFPMFSQWFHPGPLWFPYASASGFLRFRMLSNGFPLVAKWFSNG